MKKLLLIFFLYLLVEGDNVIGDGLYVYHRGKHAVDELKTKVDEYYPKVLTVDSAMVKALSDGNILTADSITFASPERETVRRGRTVIHR